MHTPLVTLVISAARHPTRNHPCPATVSGDGPTSVPTTHREPLCPTPHTCAGTVSRTVSVGITSTIIALMGSCARPSPSPRLRSSRCTRGLRRLPPAPAGRWSPGRPEESHHQSPTEPYVNLSIHTARASRALETLRLPGDAERRAPPSVLVGPTLVELTHPLRSTLITRASSLVRDDPSPPDASILSPFVELPLIGFSLGIIGRVPTFHTKAWARFMPRVRRTPLGR